MKRTTNPYVNLILIAALLVFAGCATYSGERSSTEVDGRINVDRVRGIAIGGAAVQAIGHRTTDIGADGSVKGSGNMDASVQTPDTVSQGAAFAREYFLYRAKSDAIDAAKPPKPSTIEQVENLIELGNDARNAGRAERDRLPSDY